MPFFIRITILDVLRWKPWKAYIPNYTPLAGGNLNSVLRIPILPCENAELPPIPINGGAVYLPFHTPAGSATNLSICMLSLVRNSHFDLSCRAVVGGWRWRCGRGLEGCCPVLVLLCHYQRGRRCLWNCCHSPLRFLACSLYLEKLNSMC